MSAISYIVSEPNLEKPTTGTAAPTSGRVEVRIDTTANAITDGSAPGGLRALKRGEVYSLLKVIEQQLLRDANIQQ